MARTYSQAQKGYFLARAVADEAGAELARRMAPHAHLLDEEATIDRYCDIEEGHRQALGMFGIDADLRTAEQALIDWAFAAVAKDRRSARLFALNQAELAQLQQTRSLAVRVQLVDLALRLNAP